MTFLDKLLNFYNISKESYLLLSKDVNEGDIPTFKAFDNIDAIKDRILLAISNKEKILIYGDYDADGILATSILVNAFNTLNYKVDYYIPSRYIDGYGLTKEKIELAKEKGYSLIITVDNGVSAFEAIKKAKELGIELIITDHHEYVDEIDVKYFMHPKKSSFSINTSGAVVAFYLSVAMLNEYNPYLLTLASTSLISDIMPLVNENRSILKLGIKYLNQYKFDKFRILAETIIFDESTLALKVIPKINAVGRIEKGKEVNVLVKYFTTTSFHELNAINKYLNDINLKRKSISIEITNSLKIDNDVSALVYKLDILNGLCGLISNRLLSTFNKPSCIFSKDEITNALRGSIRSKAGFNVIDFINNNKDLFIQYGGHEYAAGVVIKEENLNTFKERFIDYADSHPLEDKKEGIEIGINEINFDNYDILRSFSPFGEANKEPTFILKEVSIMKIERMGIDNKHLLIPISNNIKVIGFNYNFDNLKDKTTIDLIGKFRINKFKNNISLNFTLEN